MFWDYLQLGFFFLYFMEAIKPFYLKVQKPDL